MQVTVKYPSRSRPLLFRARLQDYLTDPTVNVLCTLDLDDAQMNTPEMRDWIAQFDRVKVRWGECRTKVEAVNDGLAEEPWDGLLIVGSDDMVPQCADYGQRIAAIFQREFPAGDGVLHLNDGRVGKQLNSICCCDRAYFDRLGHCYHPSYLSLWCDNEWQEVSERLGRAVYVPDVLLMHKWVGEYAPDALHHHNESFNDVDSVTFRARQAVGFPPEWPTSRS